MAARPCEFESHPAHNKKDIFIEGVFFCVFKKQEKVQLFLKQSNFFGFKSSKKIYYPPVTVLYGTAMVA